MRGVEISSLSGRFGSAEELRSRHPYPWLVWSGTATDVAFPLEQSMVRKTVTVGRSARADAYVPDPELGEIHLLLSVESGIWYARTQSNAHTAWLNGWMLGPEVPVRLYPGDTLRVGTGSLIFESPHRFYERLTRAASKAATKTG